MAIAKRFRIGHDDVFPFGAYLIGEVAPVWDFERSSKDAKVQQFDKDSGLPLWSGDVVDADPEAGKKAKTVTVLATGVRLGEALGVQWSDVDLARGVVDITRTVSRVKGKGLQAGRLKSRASYRMLTLPLSCVELLRARRVRLGAFDGAVFPDARGGYRDVSNTANAFRAVRSGSSMEWVTSHTFRKTVATLLDQGGSSARLVADQLGHARVSMTQDVYMGRHAVDGSAAAALERLGSEPITEGNDG